MLKVPSAVYEPRGRLIVDVTPGRVFATCDAHVVAFAAAVVLPHVRLAFTA
jgi:hypothetical protein